MKSMTGYGRYTAQRDGRQVTVELKSVNHRFLDINFRMPRSFTFLEDDARKRIGAILARGHVDVFVTYRNLRRDARTVEVDEGLVMAYVAALEKVRALTGYADDRTVIAVSQLPDALIVAEAEDDRDELCALLSEAIDGALTALTDMRVREGEAMKADLLERADEIERMTRLVETRYPETVTEYQNRLRARVEELLGANMDEARLVQEVAIMADRAAVAEETVRIYSHLKQIRELCLLNEPIGRRLDFIVQELNREVNTISSKSQDIPITQAAVTCKSEIEKLREQLQNIE